MSALVDHVSFSPVDNLTITVRVDVPGGKGFDVEWCDVRCLPSSSDADVSRNVTPRAFTEFARNSASLMRLLHRIIFEDPEEGKGRSTAAGGVPRLDAAMTTNGGNTFLFFLHKRSNRGQFKRISMSLDSNGDLTRSEVWGDREFERNPIAALKVLGHFCTPEQGFVLVRPVAWSELPSELWGHVLKCLTKKEGRPVAASCALIRQVVTSATFIWAPSKLHLALDTAQEAVRLDTSTHLPIDIPPHGLDREIKIGRSRRNDVVLLRDPEVSKRHCKIWRDERGDVYIQDLASTNGTKLKKENHNEERLRPHGEGADLRQFSEPKRLELGDKVILGLTTLCLRDGPSPDQGGIGPHGSPAHDAGGAGNAATP